MIPLYLTLYNCITESADFCVTLKVNRSNAYSNITLTVLGEDCHSMQNIPVVCEQNRGIIFHSLNYFVKEYLKFYVSSVNTPREEDSLLTDP